jgi:hypothetical protein
MVGVAPVEIAAESDGHFSVAGVVGGIQTNSRKG